MSYLDKYPGCIGCPVSQYCGTMISSVRLCHSCDDSGVAYLSTAEEEMNKEEMDEYAVTRMTLSQEQM